MLPFMGQGAAQAIEDAATLKSCLLQHLGDIPAALRLYERLRLPRSSRLQGMSETNKNRFHMPDGQAQRERDAKMASGATDWPRSPGSMSTTLKWSRPIFELRV